MAESTKTAESGITAEKSVRGNFIWTSAGNAVYAASQWGMVSVLAKLGSPELVGQYALGVAVTTPVLMLAQSNLRSVIATDVTHEHRFRDYRNLRILSLFVALFAIVILSVAGHKGAESIAIMLVGIAQTVEWMSDVYHGLMQQRDLMDRMAVSMAIRGVLSVGIMAVVLKLSGSLMAALAGVVIVRLFMLFLYDSRIATRNFVDQRGRASSAPRRLQEIRRILHVSLPLGVVVMLGSLSLNIPRYFIAHSMGTRMLGIYSAIASVTAAGNLIVNALGQAATPRMAKLFSAGNHGAMKRLTAQLCGTGVLLGAGGLLACLVIGRRVLTICFGPEYADHNNLLMMLAVAAGAGYVASLLGYAITACRRFREQLPLQLACLAATVIACAVLVPRFGLMGAAAGIVAGPVIQAIGELVVLHSALRGERVVMMLRLAVRSVVS